MRATRRLVLRARVLRAGDVVLLLQRQQWRVLLQPRPRRVPVPDRQVRGWHRSPHPSAAARARLNLRVAPLRPFPAPLMRAPFPASRGARGKRNLSPFFLLLTRPPPRAAAPRLRPGCAARHGDARSARACPPVVCLIAARPAPVWSSGGRWAVVEFKRVDAKSSFANVSHQMYAARRALAATAHVPSTTSHQRRLRRHMVSELTPRPCGIALVVIPPPHQ